MIIKRDKKLKGSMATDYLSNNGYDGKRDINWWKNRYR